MFVSVCVVMCMRALSVVNIMHLSDLINTGQLRVLEDFPDVTGCVTLVLFVSQPETEGHSFDKHGQAQVSLIA